MIFRIRLMCIYECCQLGLIGLSGVVIDYIRLILKNDYKLTLFYISLFLRICMVIWLPIICFTRYSVWRKDRKLVQQNVIEMAIKKLAGLTQTPMEKKMAEYFNKNERTAVHEAAHVVVAWTGEFNYDVYATIEPSICKTHRIRYYWKIFPNGPEKLFERICIYMAGYIAEAKFVEGVPFFNFEQLQKENDFTFIWTTAVELGKQYLHWETFHGKYFPKNSIEIEEVIAFFLERGFRAASEILNTHLHVLERMTTELLRKKTLKHEQLLALLGPHPNKKIKMFDKFCIPKDDVTEIRTNNKPRKSFQFLNWTKSMLLNIFSWISIHCKEREHLSVQV